MWSSTWDLLGPLHLLLVDHIFHRLLTDEKLEQCLHNFSGLESVLVSFERTDKIERFKFTDRKYVFQCIVLALAIKTSINPHSQADDVYVQG